MANDWTMNRTSLEKGMLIRRPGLDESLEVVNVRNGQAKIKLPDGKTSTISASAEVEWSWPEMDARKVLAGNTREKFLAANPEIAKDIQPETDLDADSSSDWQTDWSKLGLGIHIEVLGEPGDFTILRLTDSSARIKHNATGQIQPLSIGHKFKVIESGDGDTIKTGEASKPVKSKSKSKASKKATTPVPELPLAELDSDDELAIDTDETEPSDEILTAIENGDEIEDEDLAASASDDLDTDDIDDEEIEIEIDNDDNDNDDEQETNSMPQTQAFTATKSGRGALLTLGQVSEQTGISYPTLVRYVRDHGDRLPSEGEGRSRRYYPEAIDIFNEIRSSTRGGRKPGASAAVKGASGRPANSRKPRSDKGTSRADRPEPSQRLERSHETAAPYAAPVRATQVKTAARTDANQYPLAGDQTIDGMLASAIEHARARISGLESLIDNLEAQRESLRLWS